MEEPFVYTVRQCGLSCDPVKVQGHLLVDTVLDRGFDYMAFLLLCGRIYRLDRRVEVVEDLAPVFIILGNVLAVFDETGPGCVRTAGAAVLPHMSGSDKKNNDSGYKHQKLGKISHIFLHRLNTQNIVQ